MTDFIYGILVGAGTGVLAGLSGWFKNGGGFDLKKLAPTLILSGIAGAFIGAQNLAVDDANLQIAVTGLASAGLGVIIQNLLKGLFDKKKTK